ncbi:DUF1592 domain-containing protein [Rhodopirellula sp. JC639]|uniref:DUF1592 domain-containing protein n=1 Tax=Stieleria mannarensis TaxID=2755585 RepID=UPI001603C0D0|nr:DUF1592 domain-containing protein [Rhodopirellula sp. JC639]
MNTPASSCARTGLLRTSVLFALVFAVASNLNAAENASSADPQRATRTEFVQQFCIDCHDQYTQEGDLNLEDLTFDPSDASNRRRWVAIFDRVRSGEMPPEEGERPDQAALEDFLASIDAPLVDVLRQETQTLGRVRSRRLNRTEYENTMHDLLGIDIPLRDFLPEDTYHDGFATVARAQQISHHLLEKYLDAADAALEEAFGRALDGQRKPFSHTYSSAELGRKVGQRDPWHVGDKTIAWSATQVYHGRVPETEVKRTGWYRITLHDAHAVNVKSEQGKLEQGQPAPGIWCTVRTGVCFANAPMMYLAGIFRADTTPRDVSFDAWIRKGHLIEARPTDHTIERVRGTKLNNYRGSTRDKRPMPKAPGLAYTSITMQSIHKAPPADAVARILFGKFDVSDDMTRDELARVVRRFATRAFRRPLTDDQWAPYLSLVDEDLDAGIGPRETLLRAYRTILCSPRFLYFNETPGGLDDHAIATRLSYFLWSTMPDETLRAAARAGELTDSTTRRRHVQQMLDDPRTERLIDALADQWLNLREIDFTTPDAGLYPEFDETLQQSMVDETHAFLAKLIRDDLPAANLIDSDFAMLNERLAKHYGIPDVHHEQIKAVSLPPDSHRGGLITQGSILKVTANGTTTSPVIRGAFINERILGVEIPPPPDNVPAIEPDIRGAVSIRDQLEKHSNQTSCAACHIKIDPPGFALENYDVTGGWRTRYRNSRNKKSGLPVDPHHQTADGEAFQDIEQFKQIILRDPAQIARNFTHQLTTYSTGAPVSFSDRIVVEEILEQTRPNQYGIRSLIHAVVDSPLFLHK